MNELNEINRTMMLLTFNQDDKFLSISEIDDTL